MNFFSAGFAAEFFFDSDTNFRKHVLLKNNIDKHLETRPSEGLVNW